MVLSVSLEITPSLEKGKAPTVLVPHTSTSVSRGVIPSSQARGYLEDFNLENYGITVTEPEYQVKEMTFPKMGTRADNDIEVTELPNLYKTTTQKITDPKLQLKIRKWQTFRPIGLLKLKKWPRGNYPIGRAGIFRYCKTRKVS